MKRPTPIDPNAPKGERPSLSPGIRLGPYEIVTPIGAGGMGEVWKARDTRLDRDVAIKVLPAAFANDVQLRSRFEREAKIISQLSHPNICTLFDVGVTEANQAVTSLDSPPSSLHYLVMELIDGESVADRIARGPLPVADVLRYGAEIARALDRAHREGVIHRDLKPGNVMLTRTGAKLLDFGLAKGAGMDFVAEGPTVQKPLTQEGTILGTFQYMAPEQLEGEESDARTDIFAFGALLYEMLTGQRAFAGKNRTSLIASIVSGEPRPVAELRPMTPPVLEHVIARCLEKHPDDRWQSAADIAQELQWIAEAGSQSGMAAPLVRSRRRRDQLATSALVVLAITAIVLGALLARGAMTRQPKYVLSLLPPPGSSFNAAGDFAGPAVVSPDGTRVVFSAGENHVTSRLFVRNLSTGETRELPGTETGTFPFWSPDGRQIAFFTIDKLKRIPVDGGPPIDVCDVSLGRGGAWGPDDVILLSPRTTSGIERVSARGGEPVAVTKTLGRQVGEFVPESESTTHRWPEFLPDGKHFVYLAANHFKPENSAIFLASIDGKENRELFRSVSSAVYASGHLLYGRDGVLYAQKLDRKWMPVGDPVRVADDCLYDAGIWRVAASASTNGTLVFHSATGRLGSQISWFDRSGKKIGDVGERDVYFSIRLSPDETKLAVTAGDPRRDLWTIDLERGVRTKITADSDFAGNAAWSRGGKELWFTRSVGDQWRVESQLVGTGRAPERRGEMHAGATIADITPDGRYAIVHGASTTIMDTASGESETVAEEMYNAAISPDGRWIAYEGFSNGRTDVFVSSFPDMAAKWQLSPAGGIQPRWRGDGKELFFVTLDLNLSSVGVSEDADGLRLELPERLFPLPLKIGGFGLPWDVTADGQRFIANVTTLEDTFTTTVISDWR